MIFILKTIILFYNILFFPIIGIIFKFMVFGCVPYVSCVRLLVSSVFFFNCFKLGHSSRNDIGYSGIGGTGGDNNPSFWIKFLSFFSRRRETETTNDNLIINIQTAPLPRRPHSGWCIYPHPDGTECLHPLDSYLAPETNKDSWIFDLDL